MSIRVGSSQDTYYFKAEEDVTKYNVIDIDIEVK